MPPPIVHDPVPALSLPVPDVTIVAEGRATPGAVGQCAIAEAVARAFVGDPAVSAAIAAAQPPVRLESGAIALWNGRWVDRAGDNGALAPLRRVARRTAASFPGECRTMRMVGPRLIPFDDARRTSLVVIGSGTWSWDEVIGDSVLPGQPPAP